MRLCRCLWKEGLGQQYNRLVADWDIERSVVDGELVEHGIVASFPALHVIGAKFSQIDLP